MEIKPRMKVKFLRGPFRAARALARGKPALMRALGPGADMNARDATADMVSRGTCAPIVCQDSMVSRRRYV